MKNLKKVINDIGAFNRKIIIREGFPFTCITLPTNVYDAILIKPQNAQCFCPNYPNYCDVTFTEEDYVDFINRYDIEKAFIISENIEFIKKCPSLKYLRIIPSDTAGDGFDYSPLESLNGIKYLNCATKYGDNFANTTSINYSKILGVEAIHLVGDDHNGSNMITTLKSCNISESKKRLLSEVISSSQLDYLHIFQCKFKSLDGIQKLGKLQYLNLSYNRMLEDLSDIASVGESLKELSIENCPKIKDFSFLKNLKNLEVLTIYGKNTLPNLDFLKDLKNLRCFAFNISIENGDLTPCLNLEHSYSAIDRKHYNYKNSDLPKSNKRIRCVNIDEWRMF